ncbi:hypothetical protein ACMFMG_000506 [Clarireedia jacksonii]
MRFKIPNPKFSLTILLHAIALGSISILSRLLTSTSRAIKIQVYEIASFKWRAITPKQPHIAPSVLVQKTTAQLYLPPTTTNNHLTTKTLPKKLPTTPTLLTSQPNASKPISPIRTIPFLTLPSADSKRRAIPLANSTTRRHILRQCKQSCVDSMKPSTDIARRWTSQRPCRTYCMIHGVGMAA